MGLAPDGDVLGTQPTSLTSPAAKPLPGVLIWSNPKFFTLSAGMALGLFAQIGLTAHLFSVLVPTLGAQRARLAMGSVTAMAIAGRSLLGWAVPFGADRPLIARAGYAAQFSGSLFLIGAADTSVPLLLGVVLFGIGSGNATSLPALLPRSNSLKTTYLVWWP